MNDTHGAGGTPDVPPALRMRGITKRYPGVIANRSIDLTVEKGSIHGLLGENGAGKSTLMKILFGLVTPDEGTIEKDGEVVSIESAAKAIELGIGMVQQHFSLIADFTVAENLVLGHEPVRRGLLDLDQAQSEIQALSDRYRFRIDPTRRVGDLAVGARQRIEILKALYHGAEILILDEPTAALAPHEIEELSQVLHELRDQGRTVIFISHKLPEVIALCDRVSVLRDGAVEGRRDIHPHERLPGADRSALVSELARLMVGRDLPEPPPHDTVAGEVVLHCDGVGDGDRLGPLDLVVRSGEIVGIAGVEGNGQTELVELIVGVRRAATGRLTLDGVDITKWSVHRRLESGVGHIAEDRHAAAIAEDLDLAHNVTLGFDRTEPLARHFRSWLSLSTMRRLAGGVVSRFQVRAGTVRDPVSSLSGGNQQKLVVGRELSRGPRLFIAAQPTRGLDVGATAFVHDELAELRRQGVAIVLVSLELTEILALSDRIVVMSDGEIAGETLPGDVDLATLGAWMTGEAPGAAVDDAAVFLT
jgi:simple sugar transport system ATP-binding protein